MKIIVGTLWLACLALVASCTFAPEVQEAEGCESIVSFDTEYVPEASVEEIDQAIRWVLVEYPGITDCTDATVWRVNLHEDLYATTVCTIFECKVSFGDNFLEAPLPDKKSILLHEFYHIKQLAEEADEFEGMTMDCADAVTEIRALNLEVEQRYKTGLTPEMMVTITKEYAKFMAMAMEHCDAPVAWEPTL
jgi:hypothetical protein